VRASGETTFYLLELLKVLVPALGITFILVAVVRRYRAVRSRALACLAAVTAMWLLVSLTQRLALSGPAQGYFISAAIERYAAAQRESFYFSATEWLWTAEQIIVLLFGITLFLALRGKSSEPA
jgi:hypothetical protein